MTISTFLEDFASVSPDIGIAAPKPEDLVGYSLGYDAGIADAAAQSTHATKELANVIEELNFGYQEAVQEALRALRPLFSMLVSKVIPESIDASFQTLVLEAIEKAAAADINNKIAVFTNPIHTGPLSEASKATTSCPISLIADPNLPPSEVRIEASGTETSLDSDLLKSELVRAISAFHDTFVEEELKDG